MSSMAESTLEAGTIIAVDLAEKSIIKILHVDDEVGFLKTAKSLLEMHGNLKIDYVSSVEEAWKKLKKNRFDAIISDYQMPGKDGLELLKKVERKPDLILLDMLCLR